VHKKGGIISLGCDRCGLQRSPLAYGRLKLIATALYRHGLYRHGLYRHGLYRHGLYRHGLYRHGVAQGALNFAIP